MDIDIENCELEDWNGFDQVDVEYESVPGKKWKVESIRSVMVGCWYELDLLPLLSNDMIEELSNLVEEEMRE